jgi:thiol-disulfide isomerase/thioredoxin
MKKLNLFIVIFISVIVIISCSKKNNEIDYVIISGTIENPIIDSLIIWDIDYNTIQTIHLDKNNSFIDTIYASKGYYKLSDRQNSINLFLNPSMNLNATISYRENVPSSLFQNNGANENNYLYQKEQLNKSFEKVEHYTHTLGLNEEDFLKLADSINTVKTTFLKSQKNLDNDFLLYESFAIENDRNFLLQKYQRWHGEFIKDPNFKVSNNYPNIYVNIDISNEKLLVNPLYKEYLLQFIAFKMEEIDDKTFLNELEVIDMELKNQKIKDKVAYERMKFQTERIMIDDIYNKYMSMVKNKSYKEEIEENRSNLKKIEKGAVSPTFELYDINNNLVTLESLSGKLVLIDIWATWCVPCVKEIPSLKLLENEFKDKDIYFVSICLKDSKERFEKFVQEKELGGIQLFAPDENISFFKEYLLRKTGIPRFILIDKEGKIIESNAVYPSNPILKEQILENL